MNPTVFICSLVDESETNVVRHSFAGQLYQQKVVKSFPFSQIFSFNVHSKSSLRFKQENNISFYQYPDRKLLRYYDVIRFIASINKQVEDSNNILFYNITTRNFLIFLFFKYIRRQRVYILLADYSPPRKNIISFLFNILLRKSDGLFALSRHIKIHPNIVYQEILIENSPQKNISFELIRDDVHNVLFSGSIGKTTGVHIAIGAIALLPAYHLHISGNLFDINLLELQHMLSVSHNITYHGPLDRSDYLALLNKCGICLSLRDVNDQDHLYNFPSKIGEYLSHNKIVISSLLYPGFEGFLNLTAWTQEAVAIEIARFHPSQNSCRWIYENFGLSRFAENLKNLLNNAVKK